MTADEYAVIESYRHLDANKQRLLRQLAQALAVGGDDTDTDGKQLDEWLSAGPAKIVRRRPSSVIVKRRIT